MPTSTNDSVTCCNGRSFGVSIYCVAVILLFLSAGFGRAIA
jgi:hypothetical protein